MYKYILMKADNNSYSPHNKDWQYEVHRLKLEVDEDEFRSKLSDFYSKITIETSSIDEQLIVEYCKNKNIDIDIEEERRWYGCYTENGTWEGDFIRPDMSLSEPYGDYEVDEAPKTEENNLNQQKGDLLPQEKIVLHDTLNLIASSDEASLKISIEKFCSENNLNLKAATQTALLKEASNKLTDCFLNSFEKSPIGQEIKNIWDEAFKANPNFKQDMDKMEEMYDKIGTPIFEKLSDNWMAEGQKFYDDPSNFEARDKEIAYKVEIDSFFKKWNQLENEIQAKHGFDNSMIKQLLRKSKSQENLSQKTNPRKKENEETINKSSVIHFLSKIAPSNEDVPKLFEAMMASERLAKSNPKKFKDELAKLQSPKASKAKGLTP